MLYIDEIWALINAGYGIVFHFLKLCAFMFCNIQPCIVFFFKYPLYTMMVFDEWQYEIPIAFIVIRKCQESDLHPVLQSLSQGMPNDWMSSITIVDIVQAKINIWR